MSLYNCNHVAVYYAIYINPFPPTELKCQDKFTGNCSETFGHRCSEHTIQLLCQKTCNACDMGTEPFL